MLPEFDCSFDALRLRKDLVARFGGDEEDRDYKIHSLACTMAPGIYIFFSFGPSTVFYELYVPLSKSSVT